MVVLVRDAILDRTKCRRDAPMTKVRAFAIPSRRMLANCRGEAGKRSTRII